MDTTVRPWVDGEKIPDTRIRDIFQQPPGLQLPFYRSALLIGSRGAGKTTIFRYLKETHQGIAAHISLATELTSITKQSGLGPLSFDIPRHLEPLFIGKTISLLALTICDRIFRKDLKPPIQLLHQCLPRGLCPVKRTLSDSWIRDAKNTVAKAPFEAFSDVSEMRPLPQFVSAVGELCEKTRGPLLLLLDRAELILAPSLVPVLELLDQSSGYITLVAMRPGHAGEAIARISDTLVAGDNYAVVHLGTEPRSTDWAEFVQNAVQAQIGNSFSSLPKEIKRQVIAISRDSLRTALELFARFLSVESLFAKNELVTALEDLRDNQLGAAHTTLRKYHPNFRRMINDVRTEALEKHGKIIGPVVLSLRRNASDDLFTPNWLNRFIEVALRAGALCMPEGQRWMPGVPQTEVEVPPIFVWQKGDPIWRNEGKGQILITRNDRDLLRSFGGPPKAPTVFVAFRMDVAESKRFRSDLETAVKSHHDLSQLELTDGHVAAGTQWAEMIRKRIGAAKALVGDVEGMSPEVLFELGFGYGLKKVQIPAISSPLKHPNLPSWLGATQIGHYGDHFGLMGLLSSISAHLSDPEYSKPAQPPKPVPSLVYWARNLSWNAHELEQCRMSAERIGLKFELPRAGEAEEIIIRRAASASLLVVSLDGTKDDTLMHYICGTVAAVPKVGVGKTLARMILVLEEPSQTPGSLVAKSLRRCPDTVRLISLSHVKMETEHFCRAYHEWSKTEIPGKRK